MSNFDKIKPIFNIDDEINSYVNDINRKLKQIKISDKQKRKYMVSKSRVRSIHSSLSIEDNSLSLFDVNNIIQNKRVLGKTDEIQEVKNAIEVYNQIKKYDYKSETDLMKAHQLMMKYFDENSSYRNHGEGIEKDGVLIFQAPDSILVPSLMKSLFDYIKNSDINLLILASIFHYYFVYIHPFLDGNGRIARFWMSLMLFNYNKNFEFIPIEEELYLNQEQYYYSIMDSHLNHNANSFIKFCLNTINILLDKIINNNSFVLNETQEKIVELIVSNKYITQNDIAKKLKFNVRTIKRNFKFLEDNGIIERIGSDKTGYWEVK